MVLPDFWFYPKVNRIPFFYPYRGKPTDVVTAKHYEIIKESYNVFLKVLLDTSDKVGLMSKAVMEAMQANFSKNLLAKKVVGYSEKETMQNALMHPEMFHNPQLQLSHSFTASACDTNDRIYTEISSTSGEHAPCTFCSDLHNNVVNSPMYQLMQANKEKHRLDWHALRDGDFYLIDAEGWHEIMKSGRRSIFAGKVKAYNAKHPRLTPVKAARKVAIEEGTDKGLLDWYISILERGEARSEFADKVKAYNAKHPHLSPVKAARKVAIEEGTDKWVLDWYVANLERSEFADKVKAYNAKHPHLTPVKAARKVAIEEGTDKGVLDGHVANLEQGEAQSEFTDKVKAYNAKHPHLTPVEAARKVAIEEGTKQGVVNWYVAALEQEANILRRDAKIHGTEETIDLFCGACEVAGKEYKVEKNKAANEKKLRRKHKCRRVGCAANGKLCRFYSREEIDSGCHTIAQSKKKYIEVPKASDGDISYTPTWRKWIGLSRGEKLTYGGTEVIKGKEGDEERLRHRIICLCKQSAKQNKAKKSSAKRQN
eukprot:scaffold40998_cov155-Skeletonema_dohrnii-CCMP3373.AAC.2